MGMSSRQHVEPSTDQRTSPVRGPTCRCRTTRTHQCRAAAYVMPSRLAVAPARLTRPPALNRGGGGKITAREIVLNAVSHFSALGESGAFYYPIIGVHLAQNIVPPPALPLGGQL